MIFSFAPDFCLVVKAEGEGELQGGQSNIVNGSFEEPSKYRLEDLAQAVGSQKGYKEKVPQSEIPGWNTTSTEGAIELGWLKGNGTSPHMIPTVVAEIASGIGASDGWQFAETIGDEASTLYQSLSLEAGMSYDWTIHHRGRDGVDTLALFFVEDTGVNYVKSAKEGSDHFDQIVEWMKKQNITAPAAGEMVQYTVYSTALGNNGTFTESDAGYFSFDPDAEHTVKFEVHLMSTGKAAWGEYTGDYLPEADEDTLFALTCFHSASKSQTSGNLVDNISFSGVYDKINLLKNPGFEDAIVTSTSGYQPAKAANAPSPFSNNIGWCSTASDYVVEIGTLKGGKDAYGLGVVFKTVMYNAPSIRDGEQFAELNADQESSLYQIVTTDPGKMYKWSLSHRGRDGLDTMALVIGPNQTYAPKKTSEIARDQLMQIVDWLYSQKDVVLDIPDKGCSNEIKLYTPKFNDDGGFVGDVSTFSWYADETHTEEWSVWIISSDNSGWHDYGEIEEGAAYNYDYIVPQGQTQSIFGFVSVKSAPKASDGKLDKTYGNFLDNIAFKEYYYVHAKFDGGKDFGIVTVDPENKEHFISTDLDSNEVGWSLAGSKITFSFQEEGRTFLGAYINGVFHPKDDTSFWTLTVNEQGKNVYSFERIIDAAVTIKVVYQAKNVIYDTRNGYTYQYDLLNPNSGREVPMGIGQDGHLEAYTSHEPQFDDGWEFLGWRYIEIEGGNHKSHLVKAVHKVQCDEKTITDAAGDTITKTTLSIWEKGENDGDDKFSVLVDDGIPIDEGITFFGEWKYRQRVIAQTFNLNNSSYDISTEGGEVEVKIAFTEDKNPSTPTDYKVGDDVVGKDIFAAADGTYINITAKNKPGYVFNGWYDKDGKLVDRNPSYTYKVVDGGVLTYYARFELPGENLTISTTVDGEEDKYFAVDCTFSSLRQNLLYAISGLVSDPITVNGEVVTNPTILRADASGNAQVTIYVKNGDRAVFEHLPENCVYSVSVQESSKDGYSVKGEVSEQTFGTADLTIELALKKSKQESWIAPGKHYQDIFAYVNSSGIIAITPESSFTLYVETAYAPSFYTNLSASLCFFNAQGEAQNFANGTRILMIDKCNAEEPKFYCFIVGDDSTSEIALTDFTALGSQDVKFALPSGEDITEKLLFAVDYVGTNNAPSGKLSLLYRNESVVTINPEYKAVATGDDATSFTMTAQNANAASVGPFEVKLTVSTSSPTVNTTYVGNGDAKYSVKLSLDGGMLPEGSYAEINGTLFHSNNGYIIVSPLSSGEFTVNLYSRKPLVDSTGEKVKIKAELLSAVSTVKSISAGKSVTVEFTCVNAEKYAMDADIPYKVLTPGYISQTDITLKHEGIDKVLLTVSKKNNDGTYSEMFRNIDIALPTGNNPVTVNLGSGFKAEPGETYIFSFVGYADGVPVCRDDCCIVGGYE